MGYEQYRTVMSTESVYAVSFYAGEDILYSSQRIPSHDDQGSAPRRLTYEEAVEEAGMLYLCWKRLFLFSHTIGSKLNLLTDAPLFGLCIHFYWEGYLLKIIIVFLSHL